MFDFPTTTAIGTTIAVPDGSLRTWDGVKWRWPASGSGVTGPGDGGGGGGPYLPVNGGTMIGPLYWTSTGATQERAAQDRSADTVSVKDFGASCDGVTDDTAALQAALNAPQLANGGTVSIGRNKLRINGHVTMPMMVRLVGDCRHPGLNASQDWYQVGAQICLGPSASISVGGGCEIDHIMFIRAGLYTSLPASIADANAIIANFSGTALDCTGAPDWLISGCMFLGFTTGINAPNTSRVSIIDCLFDCTNGVYSSQSSDISRYERLHFWPLMTLLVPGVGVNPGPLRRAGYAMKLESNTWDQLINCFQFGYDGGFWVDYSTNTNFVACHSDYPNDLAASLGGFRFTGAGGYAKMTSCLSMTPVVVDLIPGGPGQTVEIIGGSFVNGGINVITGTLLIHCAEFENCNPAINYGSGTINGSVVGCNFDRCPTTVAFASSAVQALVSVVANIGLNGSPITNGQLMGNMTLPFLTVNGPTPDVVLYNTSAGADQKQWDILPDSSGNLSFRMLKDDFSAENTWMQIGRTGYAPAQLAITVPSITLNGKVGFNGTPAIAAPTVTGAWAGNTAGKALSVALANYGLIIDNTTP